MRRSILLVGLLALAAGLCAGCGPRTSTVSGEVSVDGKPLEKGVIAFTPADGGPPITVPIQNGKYELRTTPGNNRVQISAPAVVGKRKEHNGPGAALVEITAERLPPRYNSQTELTAELQPGGNIRDWSITTRPGKP